MDPIDAFPYILAIAAVAVGGVWFVYAVIRAGNPSARTVVKWERKRQARLQRLDEQIVKAEAKLDAEGWKP
jgi:hypothetical protein